MSESELESIAAEWIARRDSGLRSGDEAALKAWLKSDERHAQAFARCEAAWNAMPALRWSTSEVADILPRPRRGKRAWLRPSLAGLAAAAIFLILFLRRQSADRIVRHYEAAQAETHVMLPDGSAVELRRGGEFLFSEERTVRRVDLLRGEAHFTVVDRASQPFVVRADNILIRDLGTAFDVRVESDYVAVLVTQGRVEVSGPNGLGGSTLMTRGQQASLRTAGPAAKIEVRESSGAEIERVLAWRNGQRQVFLRTPLSDAASELNHYNRHQLIIANPETGSVLVSGSVEPGDTEAFISLLQSGFGVIAERRSTYETALRWSPKPSSIDALDSSRSASESAAEHWLAFSRTPLAEAVKQFNRHNRRQLVVADAMTGSLLISGSVERGDVEAFVSMLETGFGVTADHRPEDGTVLLRKSP